MPRKLTDAQIARMHDRQAEGATASAIAREFGVSPQYASRVLRGEARTQILGALDKHVAIESGVVEALERFLLGIELDADDAVRASSARVLAAKLDDCRASATAAAATAAPNLARSLLEVMAELRGRHEKPDALDEVVARRQARQLAEMELYSFNA
jgi:transcriptional regulator with XRE-family HTH domain